MQALEPKLKSFFEESMDKVLYTEEDISKEQKECRICLDEASAGNPLIVPCHCTGSIRFVHTLCLRKWIQKQYENNIRRAECELCKEPFVYSLKLIKECNSCE